MKVEIEDVKQIGQIAKLTRKAQGLDQVSAAMLSGNGSTFMSDFENGKPTVELKRALSVLASLGVTVELDIPVEIDTLTKSQRALLTQIKAELTHVQKA